LEKAIRNVQLEEVRTLLSSQKLSHQDKDRLSFLTLEVVRNREAWTREWIFLPEGNVRIDPSTPYNPNFKKIVLELISFFTLLGGGLAVAATEKSPWLALGMCASSWIPLIMSINDTEKEKAHYIALLHRKYEDSLTIQQLIFTAEEAW
jgi:hypothetical protein